MRNRRPKVSTKSRGYREMILRSVGIVGGERQSLSRMKFCRTTSASSLGGGRFDGMRSTRGMPASRSSPEGDNAATMC